MKYSRKRLEFIYSPFQNQLQDLRPPVLFKLLHLNMAMSKKEIIFHIRGTENPKTYVVGFGSLFFMQYFVLSEVSSKENCVIKHFHL